MPERLELSDEELMRLYQEGHEEAFRVLYARHSGRVYGYLRKRLPTAEAAGDVFQAAFLKLHHSRQQFNSSFAFTPWLFTVVRTSLIDWQRRSARQSSVPFEESMLPVESPQANLAPVPDLSHLPLKQRTAVEMRVFGELSFEEIATRLNTTPVNARQILSRALKSLRSLLVKTGGEK